MVEIFVVLILYKFGGSVTTYAFFGGWQYGAELVLLIVHDEYALNQIIGKSNTCLWSSFGSQGLAKSNTQTAA